MSKRLKLSSFDPVNFVLIGRSSAGEKVGSLGSRGDVEYAKGLAYSLLRADQTLTRTHAYVEIYSQCDTPWQELDPLTTVSLDDEGVEA